MTREMTGAEMGIKALADQNVQHASAIRAERCCRSHHEIFSQHQVRHILVRHEQGAEHAAEGYALLDRKKSWLRPGDVRSRRHQFGHRPGGTRSSAASYFHCLDYLNRPNHRSAMMFSRKSIWLELRVGAQSTTTSSSVSRICRALCTRHFTLLQAAGAGCRRRAERHSVCKGRFIKPRTSALCYKPDEAEGDMEIKKAIY